MRKSRSLIQRGWPSAEKGQALVEFSLVLAFILVPVMIGILDGGMLFFKLSMIEGTSREGARAGAIYQSSNIVPGGGDSCAFAATVDAERAAFIIDVIDQTMGPLVPFPDPPTTTVQIAYDHDHDGDFNVDGDADDIQPQIPGLDACDPYRAGDAVRVTITHQHRAILGLVINLFAPIPLRSEATMVLEPGGAAS